jgi:hypothetical protein
MEMYTATGNCKSLAVKGLEILYASMDTVHYFILQNVYRTNYRFIPYNRKHILIERPHTLVQLAQLILNLNFKISIYNSGPRNLQKC